MTKLSQDASGFTLIELLVGSTVLLFVMAGLAGMMIQNSRLSRKQQMIAQVQSDARNCLSMVLQKLRSAGWNPHESIDFEPVTLDQDLGDAVSQIDIRADLNEDGDIDDPFEQLTIRHIEDRIEWRKTPDSAFETLAIHITNDADGDNVVEPMFVADSDPPTRVQVTVTARSAVPDYRTREFIRYTVRSQVALREAL